MNWTRTELVAAYTAAATAGTPVTVRDEISGSVYTGPAAAVYEAIKAHIATHNDDAFAPINAADQAAWAVIEAAYN